MTVVISFRSAGRSRKDNFLSTPSQAAQRRASLLRTYPWRRGASKGIRNIASQLVRAWLLTDEIGPLRASTLGPEYLQNLLKRVATKRDTIAPDDRIVIVVDSLELARGHVGGNVLGVPKYLPKGVYILASQRPVNVSLDVAVARPVISMAPRDETNLHDLQIYIHRITASGALGQILAPTTAITESSPDAVFEGGRKLGVRRVCAG